MTTFHLYLENGKHFKAESFGAHLDQPLIGEMVFNTSMSGYQEIISDPSYCDQILVMTSPLIGNVGINSVDFESMNISLNALIVHEVQHHPSHWQSNMTLSEFLKEKNIVAISGVDTRHLTKMIRERGAMKAIIFSSELSPSELHALFLKKLPQDQIHRVSLNKPMQFPGIKDRIVLIDYGYKKNILRSLLAYQSDVVIVPYNFKHEEIMKYKPKGIVLSNGPGDPKDVPESLETIKFLQERIPLLGICMGHQLFALANGANTFKMPFGHRGGNHPIKDLKTSKIFMTSQNHGYAVDESSLLKTQLEISQINLNDETIEGLRHTKYQAFSVQYHPEACPGPTDTKFIFDEFFKLLT